MAAAPGLDATVVTGLLLETVTAEVAMHRVAATVTVVATTERGDPTLTTAPVWKISLGGQVVFVFLCGSVRDIEGI